MKTVVGNSEYRLESALGRGGMGEVWKATDLRTKRAVAVKILSAPHLADDQFEAAVRREVPAMATLEHPNVVLVHDYGRVEAGSFIVMELARESLGHIMMRRPLRWSEIREVLDSVLEALAHAHGRGLIHRDIKPDNVLVFRDEGETRWKVTDFGISHTIDPENASVHEFAVGTPEFMPPEQFGGQWREYGPSTDLYAVGCLAWMLATGEPPFPGKTLLQLAQQHMYEVPGKFSPVSAMPEGFEEIIRRLLQKSSRDRYPFAADALHAIRALNDRSLHGLERTSSEMREFRRTTGGAGQTSSARIAETMGIAKQGREEPKTRPSETMRERRKRVPPMPIAWERPYKRRSLPTAPSLFGMRTIPFIGRSSEIDLIWSRLHQLFHGGEPRGFVIEGPTGTGKSRLAEAVCERALEVGAARVFKVEHSERSRFEQTMVEALKFELRCNGLKPDEMAARLTELFSVEDELPEWAVGVLVSAFSEEAVADEQGENAQSVEEAIVEVFRRFTEERPLIVWLDDWQWADGTSGLARAVAGHGLPILWLATVQTDALIARGGTPLSLAWMWKDAERIEVGPLGDAEIERLLGRLLNLDSRLLRKLARSVQGNPLFAVQMVGNWVERGLLIDDDGRFGLADGATLEPPDDLHSVWSNRVEQLLRGKDEPDGEALEIASLIGGDIDEVMWLRACFHFGIRPSEELLDDMIEQRLALRNEQGWSFVHGMLRASLERRAREAGRLRAAHSAIADALQETEVRPSPAMLGRIGRHLAEAERYEEALGPLFGGARRQVLRGEYAGADAAIALYLEVARKADVHPRHIVLGEIECADILARRGEDDAEEVLQRAIDRARKLGEWALLVRGQTVRSEMAYVKHRYDEAKEAMDEAFELAREHSVNVTPEMYVCYADTLAYLGSIDRAERYYRRAEEGFRTRRDDSGRASCEYGLGWIEMVRGNLARAEAMLRAASRRFAGAGNRRKERQTAATLGDVLRRAGRFEEARRIYLETVGVGSKREPGRFIPMHLNIAQLEIEAGNLTEAQRWLDRLRAADVKPPPRLECLRRVLMMLLAARRERWLEFDTYWDGLPELFLSSAVYEADTIDMLERAGHVAADSGENDRALALVEILEPAWERLGQHGRHRNYLVKVTSTRRA